MLIMSFCWSFSYSWSIKKKSESLSFFVNLFYHDFPLLVPSNNIIQLVARHVNFKEKASFFFFFLIVVHNLMDFILLFKKKFRRNIYPYLHQGEEEQRRLILKKIFLT